MEYLNCCKCGKKVRVQYKSHLLKHKKEEIECLDCNPNQVGFICKECGDTILFTENVTGNKTCLSCAFSAHIKNHPEIRKKLSEAGKKRFDNMTEEERRQFSQKRKEQWTDERKKKQSELQRQIWTDEMKQKASERNSGKNNWLYGKSIKKVYEEKYGKEEAEKKFLLQVKHQRESFHKNHSTPEQKQRFIEKSVHYGKENGMYGRSFYDVWVEKYGKEEADRRLDEHKRKKSEKNKGKNNPMYGKPAPKGAGNGISGWYKGWYFRSLRELSYMVNVIEKEGHEWRSLDNTPDFRIKYLDKDGHERSYCPDFLIDNKIVVEIKPEKLQQLDLVVRKQNAAIMYCKTRNLVHIITDVEIMDFSIIEKMIENEKIKLTEKSLIKFNKYKAKRQRRIQHAEERRNRNDN